MAKRKRPKADRREPTGRPQISVKGYLDEQGRPISVLPDKVSATFMRRVYRSAKDNENDLIVQQAVAAEGIVTEPGMRMARAQVPWVVTLLIYSSPVQMEPVRKEYYLYAPADERSAAIMARTLWLRWEKTKKREKFVVSMEDDYPRLGHGVVAEPIDDAHFDDIWNYVKTRPHRCAGDPKDPWAFAPPKGDSILTYRTEDFQKDLIRRL